jgi:predicted amidohydrolase
MKNIKKFKIALAQINPALGDLDKNIKKHLAFCDRAIKQNADLIVFPELSLTGYSIKDLNFDLAVNLQGNKLLKPLEEKSKKISIICGGIEEDTNYGIFNTAFYIEGGKCRFSHRKIYPPDYGMFEEIRYFSKGKSNDVYDSKFGNLGIMVCEDLWHISVPLLMALKGAKVLITIVIKNYEINSEHHKAYARLLSSYVVFCNRVGFEDGVNFWGGSEVVDPFGNVVKTAKMFDEDLIYAEINYNNIRRSRHQARHFLDEDINFLKNTVKMMNDELEKI